MREKSASRVTVWMRLGRTRAGHMSSRDACDADTRDRRRVVYLIGRDQQQERKKERMKERERRKALYRVE